MSTFLRPLFAAILVAGAAAASPALAQPYPRISGGGESLTVDYGPMAQGTLVGGGRVMVSTPNGMMFNILHLDVQFMQSAREGYVPLTVGSGESAEIIWVPSAMVQMIRGARSSMTAP